MESYSLSATTMTETGTVAVNTGHTPGAVVATKVLSASLLQPQRQPQFLEERHEHGTVVAVEALTTVGSATKNGDLFSKTETKKMKKKKKRASFAGFATTSVEGPSRLGCVTNRSTTTMAGCSKTPPPTVKRMLQTPGTSILRRNDLAASAAIVVRSTLSLSLSSPSSSGAKASSSSFSAAGTMKITGQEIKDRVEVLFREESLLRPAVSARLFACYVLYREKLDDLQAQARRERNSGLSSAMTRRRRSVAGAVAATPPPRKRRRKPAASTGRRRSVRLKSSVTIGPILGLLRALVTVELVSLGKQLPPSEGRSKRNADNSSNRAGAIPVVKQTHFSGFDCSSAQPPVDRVDGSANHRQDAIEALVAVKEEVDGLVRRVREEDPDDDEASGEIRSCLRALAAFLGETLAGQGGSDELSAADGPQPQQLGEILLDACAESMPGPYYRANRRFVHAAGRYRLEIDRILARLAPVTGGDVEGCAPPRCHYEIDGRLFLEERLAEFVGQTVRYYLRMFFDRPPARLSPNDTQYDERTKTYSQVHTLVRMNLPAGAISDAVDDGSIAALLSAALRSLYDYFGLEALLPSGTVSAIVQDLLPANNGENTFCRRRGSLKCIVLRNNTCSLEGAVGISDPPSCTAISPSSPSSTEPDIDASSSSSSSSSSSLSSSLLTQDDMEDIFLDIHQATSFLAAARACRFLVQLFKVPGVQAEIANQGGWCEVETLASIGWRYELWRICPDDAHLTALCNFAALRDKLRAVRPAMDRIATSCEASLNDLSRRWRVNTKSKKVLSRFPQVKEIAARLREGRARYDRFPVVSAAEATAPKVKPIPAPIPAQTPTLAPAPADLAGNNGG